MTLKQLWVSDELAQKTADRVAKLPLWAQSYIAVLEGRIEQLQRSVDVIKDEHLDVPHISANFLGGFLNLPLDTRLTIPVGDDEIRIHLVEKGLEREHLHVSSTRSRLVASGDAANVLLLVPNDRWAL